MTDQNRNSESTEANDLGELNTQPLIKPVDYTQHQQEEPTTELVPKVREVKWDDLELQLQDLDQQRIKKAALLRQALQKARTQAKFQLQQLPDLVLNKTPTAEQRHYWQQRLQTINETLMKWFQTTAMADEIYFSPTLRYYLVISAENADNALEDKLRRFLTERELELTVISQAELDDLLAQTSTVAKATAVIMPLSEALNAKVNQQSRYHFQLIPFISQSDLAMTQFTELLAYPQSFFGAIVEKEAIETKIQRFLGDQLPITVLPIGASDH
ncbi:hypothetical protein ACFQ4L_06420 [Lapidilactobacillus mulanensis]|uniref:Uncharacterized protein n=1 Tax=Lapidilactobacillus mulanensis TaxID=2485999 RepID=A0ABW4DQK2_9LACO|nr:hypothetical protein [Lapidilactobacillus mulanensis]